MTKEAKFPLPQIEDSLDKLGKASYFFKIDLSSGYWQVKVHPNDIEKTAFCTQSGHHEFTVVPFGLQGAPSTFQRLMHHYLCLYLGNFCLIYIDDILIYSNSAEEHLEHIKIILNVLRENVLYAKSTKCDFFHKKIVFLGFLIKNHSISTDPAKIEAIQDWPEPETVCEVQSFLGLANFYRKFIHHHSTIAKPLTDLLKSSEFAEKFGHEFMKTAKLVLVEKEKVAFQSLKDALISAPCLIIYNPTKPTEIWGDASFDTTCVGAVLMQDHGNGFQQCCYLSKVLNIAESHYPALEQELLALKKGMVQWRDYLLPIRFLTSTDHNGLKYLKTQPNLFEHQWHWITFFSEYNFDIKYCAGSKMQVPDALSRKRHTSTGTGTGLSPLLRLTDREADHQREIQIDKDTKVFINLEK